MSGLVYRPTLGLGAQTGHFYADVGAATGTIGPQAGGLSAAISNILRVFSFSDVLSFRLPINVCD